jgi:hypothetical protein
VYQLSSLQLYTLERKCMKLRKGPYPNDSNVNRLLPVVERHLEGYEQGEAINAFLESEATDNDQLAIAVRVLEAFGMDYEASFLRLALGVPDFDEVPIPPVDEEITYNKATVRQALSRAAERLNRFWSKL